MPVIRISDETMRRLKTWAEPLEDTAESALAKALNAAEETKVGSSRSRPEEREEEAAKPRIGPGRGRPGDRLPQKKFRRPLLETLYQMGGSGHPRDVRSAMKERMSTALLPGDLGLVSTGDERWWNATCWERSALVKEGYLRADSPRGTWTLSDEGIRHVESSRPAQSSDPFVEHLLAIPDVGDDADFDRDPSGLRHVEI